MLIYKFKVIFEDQEDFQREIELRADHTFEDFHQAILGNLGLDPGMSASFFICDHRFRKQKEIALVEPFERPQNVDDEMADAPPPLMSESSLKDFIDDPHQRLLFIYDPVNLWNFYIELIRIMPTSASVVYPRFSKVVGAVPRELTTTPKPIPDEDPEMDFVEDLEGPSPDEFEELVDDEELKEAGYFEGESGADFDQEKNDP